MQSGVGPESVVFSRESGVGELSFQVDIFSPEDYLLFNTVYGRRCQPCLRMYYIEMTVADNENVQTPDSRLRTPDLGPASGPKSPVHRLKSALHTIGDCQGVEQYYLCTIKLSIVQYLQSGDRSNTFFVTIL